MSIDSILHMYRNIYYKTPQPIKTFTGSIYGSIPLSFRFGKLYSKHKAIAESFEKFSKDQKIEFMYRKTLESIEFAESHIPFYKKSFKRHGVSSKDFTSLDDLKKFPYITKDDIKKNLDELYTDIVEKPILYYSGGSLSKPTKYYHPLYTSRAKEKAYCNFAFEKIEYRYRDRSLLIKGRDVAKVDRDIYWEYEPVDNYLYLSNDYLNSDKFPLIYKRSKEFKPSIIFGYPSSVLSFVKQCKKYGFKKLDIDGVILSSETLFRHEYEIIKEFFNVKILTHYGHTERVIMAYKIDDGYYHFFNSYGIEMVINGELIGTTFDNFVMPLINYKSGDTIYGKINYIDGTNILESCENIEGRTNDFLVTKSNRLISITSLSVAGGEYISTDSIIELQYIQDTPGLVTMLIVPSDSSIDTEYIYKVMKNLTKGEIEFKIKIVNSIDKTPRGKRVICRQSLDIESIRDIS